MTPRDRMRIAAILHNQMQIMAALFHAPSTPVAIKESLADALEHTGHVIAEAKTEIARELDERDARKR